MACSVFGKALVKRWFNLGLISLMRLKLSLKVLVMCLCSQLLQSRAMVILSVLPCAYNELAWRSRALSNPLRRCLMSGRLIEMKRFVLAHARRACRSLDVLLPFFVRKPRADLEAAEQRAFHKLLTCERSGLCSAVHA